MAEYLIVINYSKNRFPQYEKLIKELEKVPNIIVYPISDEFVETEFIPLLPALTASLGQTPLVAITMYKIRGDRVEVEQHNALVSLLPSKKVVAYISLPNMKAGEATVSNDEEAISKLVLYTGRILSQITNNSEYLIPRETKEDWHKIKVRSIDVIPFIIALLDEELKEKLMEFGCYLTNAYAYNMLYEYPYRIRRIKDVVLCCNENLLLFDGMADSEHGPLREENLRSPFTLKFPSKCRQSEVRNTLQRHVLEIEAFIRKVFNKETNLD